MLLPEVQLAAYESPKTRTIATIDIPPRMILECAAGIEKWEIVAERYGYFKEQWEALLLYEPFVRAVEDKRRELHASGYTFRARAHVMANDLLEDVYHDAKQPDANSHTRLEAMKFLARAGGVEAPIKELTAPSTGVSITINIPAMGDAPAQAIEIKTGEVGRTFDMDDVPNHLKEVDGALTIELESDE